MPLVRINVLGDTPVCADGGSAEAALSEALDGLPRGAPVVVMIHGYKHSPGAPSHDPHSHMLSLTPVRGGRSLSWPRHLGFGRGDTREGLAIALAGRRGARSGRPIGGRARRGWRLQGWSDRSGPDGAGPWMWWPTASEPASHLPPCPIFPPGPLAGRSCCRGRNSGRGRSGCSTRRRGGARAC